MTREFVDVQTGHIVGCSADGTHWVIRPATPSIFDSVDGDRAFSPVKRDVTVTRTTYPVAPHGILLDGQLRTATLNLEHLLLLTLSRLVEREGSLTGEHLHKIAGGLEPIKDFFLTWGNELSNNELQFYTNRALSRAWLELIDHYKVQ